MTTFIVRRIFWTIPVILLVIFMTFVLMRQIEGNPFRQTERNVPESIQRNLERKFNLDAPWYEQYVTYVKNTFTFDFGPGATADGYTPVGATSQYSAAARFGFTLVESPA